ncbi:gag-pol [Trichonephila clavipes]|nr:gag-pol [Trichonephila clavipes]
MALLQNRSRRSITCWECGEPGHLRSNCPRNNKKDRSNKCWGCGGAGHLRNNCPRVNQDHPRRENVIESKEVCGNRKGSAKGNGDVPSRRSCPENCKYCSRIEKKFGVIDPIVRQVTTLSTSALDPWSYEEHPKRSTGCS